jgi:hypothetical protein
VSRRCWIFLLAVLVALTSRAHAIDWYSLVPNSAYSRDLAMGTSTIALTYAPQSQSINPAGLSLYSTRNPLRGSLVMNPGGFWQIRNYSERFGTGRSTGQRAGDMARMAVSSVAVQSYVVTVAALASQPVMNLGDTARYRRYERSMPLDLHQNSLVVSLALHPRVAVGGRVDRYYRYDSPQGEAYSYGVILRPKNVNLGLQYQRFPAKGAKLWHPLDRRGDQATTAGIAMSREDLTISFQVMNLTQSGGPAFLEPHAGIEWRPLRSLALRAGGMQFSRTSQWAWTSGFSLLDANWLHHRAMRLLAPDEVLQVAVGVIYRHLTPVSGVGSLTCAWRF